MSRWLFSILNFLMTGMLLLFLVMLLALLFLFVVLNGLSGGFFIPHDAFIVEVGGADSITCACSWLNFYVLIGGIGI